MPATVVSQWMTYPVTEWAMFAGIMFTGAWAGGVRGTVIAHLILFFVIHRSDARQIMSQPGGDLDLIFYMGFFSRMVSINLLLTFLIALPAILIRKPVLRFACWRDAFWRWRCWRPVLKTGDSSVRSER